MKADVYDKIIELCESSLDSLPKSESHAELAMQVVGLLSMIIGACSAAKELEKGSNNAPRR